LYVPTAFSPNGDGLNDILRPKALGIRSLTFFRVYNRWGELIFSTSQINAGWDGRYKGNPQDPGTFVWEAEAVTFRGETIRVKGNSVLIR
jgi:gliding motility-associated-like protein